MREGGREREREREREEREREGRRSEEAAESGGSERREEL